MRERRLTEYQAGAILQGKSRGLAIGNYLILDKLGKGGMGLVFKALHRRLKRVVALKVLPPSFAREDAAVFRFHREVEAVAKLGHPNIVAAFDADEFNGLHFFAMELVEGNDLHSLVKTDGPMSADQAIECLTQAAQGLKAAHEKGIYHRDIKPPNLMLDSNGTVKILDLGLARMEKEAEVLFGLAETDPGLTIPGGMMGTVSFMPPEQAVDASAADHRSDIYSLGCTFYFLLTGTPPYSGATLMECVAAHREHPIPQLRDVWPETPPYLDSMLQRMLAKEPEDRYQSINALLDDLKACRAAVPEVHPNLPAIAVPIPDHDAEIKAVTRTNASIRSVGFLAACVLLAAVAAVAVARFPRSRPSKDNFETAKPPPPAPSRAAEPSLPPSPSSAPVVTKKDTKTEPPPPEPIGEVHRFRGHERPRVESVCVTTDGKHALSAGEDGKVRCWDIATGREIGPSLVHDAPVLSVAVSSDGLRALSGCRDKTVRLWDVKTGQELARFEGHKGAVYSVAFAPDGRFALSGSGDKTVRLWNNDSGEEVDRRDHDGPVTSVAFSPDGRTALSGSGDKTIRLWNLGKPMGRAFTTLEAPDEVWCVAFSPRGDRVLSGGRDAALTLWDLVGNPDLKPIRFEVHSWVRCVAFLPDGHHAVAGTENKELLVWNLDERRELTRFTGAAIYLGVAATPDGLHALTSDDDGLVRYWRLPLLSRPAESVKPAKIVPGP